LLEVIRVMARKRVIDDYERVAVQTRAEWRRWLAAEHASSPGIWLVRFKKGCGDAPSYDEVVEEALCFGWVDSLQRKFDVERSMLLVTPRKAKSVWSAPNRERVGRLIAAGLMRPEGLAKVEAAKRDGSWEALMAAESLEVPEDLVAALGAAPEALAAWERFTRASRRNILTWVFSAKRADTRGKRVAEVVAKARVGKRANYPADG
jgi:uncharacterized protein YdeI (YjbR/CyaY-like superfamily)